VQWARPAGAWIYDGFRGVSRTLNDLTCLVGDHPLGILADPAVPTPKQIFYYAAQATNCAGESGLGSRAAGPGVPAIPCP